MKNQIFKPTLNELADLLCKEINSRSSGDCFKTIHLVFPNLKIQQWFKAYWLNTQGDAVLLNVSYETLDSILPLITENKYKLISSNNLRQIIINILSNKLVAVNPNYEEYYKDSPIKLYDFADSLTKLYLDYYKDNFEDIDGWDDPNNFERVIYDKIVEICDHLKIGSIKKPVQRAEFKGELIYFFGFAKFEKVYRTLLDAVLVNDGIKEFSLEEEKDHKVCDYEIAASPSILREVENLHSQICELLKDKNNRAFDFLVVAPNLADYITSIERVFKQDDKTFPNIPYVLSYQQKKDTDVASALKILYQAYKDKFYTRLNFYELISNPAIRAVRKIGDEDIDNWIEIIIKLNVHRRHGDVNDWDYLKKRLLLSKVSSVNFNENNLVSLKDGDYLPYSSIGIDDDSIVKLVNIVNDIDDFCAFFESKDVINADDAFVQDFKERLDKWFKAENIKDKAFLEYRKIIASLDNLKAISAQNINKDIFFYILFDAASINSTQIGTPFFDGITFINCDINSITSAKYVFLLGASSKNMPESIIKNELDQRHVNKVSDDEQIFNLIKQNTKIHLYISYVNQDLKTDEKFFLSPIIEDFNKAEGKTTKEISIDETRYYADLYTRKEFNNREYYKQLFNKTIKQGQPQVSLAVNNPLPPSTDAREIVTVSQMKAFLEDPLSYRAGCLFNKEDDFGDEIIDEYEPLNLDALSEISLSVAIVLEKYGANYNSDEVFKLFRLSHLLPMVNDSYERSVFDYLENKADLIIKMIDEITEGNKGEVIPPRDCRLYDKKGWTLKASQTYYRYISSKGERFYIAFRKDKEKEPSKFLTLYILSLMDIAMIDNEDETEYKVVLALGPKDKNPKKPFAERFQYEYEITKNDAIKTLNEIHSLMDDFTENALMSVDLAKKDINEYYDLTDNAFGDNGIWRHFDHAKLFDKDNIGYDSDNFDPALFAAGLKKHIQLIKYLIKELEELEKAVNNSGQP